jgi:hypothetical protein
MANGRKTLAGVVLISMGAACAIGGATGNLAVMAAAFFAPSDLISAPSKGGSSGGAGSLLPDIASGKGVIGWAANGGYKGILGAGGGPTGSGAQGNSGNPGGIGGTGIGSLIG